MRAYMCRGKQARAQHTHTHSQWITTGPGGWIKRWIHTTGAKKLFSFVLSQSTVQYSTEPIHYRIFYSSYRPFHLNTLRCCQPCSQWAIWWVVIRTYTVERLSTVECSVRVSGYGREREAERERERLLTTLSTKWGTSWLNITFFPFFPLRAINIPFVGFRACVFPRLWAPLSHTASINYICSLCPIAFGALATITEDLSISNGIDACSMTSSC